jgi:HD-like signal output (HDOD) protein
MASSEENLEQLIGNSITIPPQPKILVDIHELAQQKHPKLNKIAQLVSQDAGLSAVLFKIINSPFYGLSKEIDTVSQAISVLGLNPLFTIIKCVALRRSISGNSPAYERFWDRSNDLAQLCSIVANKQRPVCRVTPDQAYMLGLFSECGVAILMQRFPKYCESLNGKGPHDWPNLAEENRKFNTSHEVVGYLLARNWHLPDPICQAIRYHHDIIPHDAPETVALVAILQMAMHISSLVSGYPGTDWPRTQALVMQELGISPDSLREYEEDIVELFREQPSR